MKALCLSAIASNQGKTILTTALLMHFKNSVRPFKIGPDYIDPQFHELICHTPSVNLDSFIMSKEQVQWMFHHYHDKNIALLEGVMGFYDGHNKGCSAYDVSKDLNVPTILLLDGSGSYITISAVLKGLLSYKDAHTIQGIILNKLSSSMHYELIKTQIKKDHPSIEVLGWIKKDLNTLKDTHLGLDIEYKDQDVLKNIAKEVLEHIDVNELEKLSSFETKYDVTKNYPFDNIPSSNKKISIVYDKNFSFLYHDNLEFLKEVFDEVEIINACKDESISESSDVVYIPGGYVETNEAYKRIEHSNAFKSSLIKHSKSKPIYAECAGLLYLGDSVDDKKMSSILNINFTLKDKRSRLGYYFSSNGIKGHAFHYTAPTNAPKGAYILSKKENAKGSDAAWQKNKVFGTYLHTMFRNNINILKDYFGI